MASADQFFGNTDAGDAAEAFSTVELESDVTAPSICTLKIEVEENDGTGDNASPSGSTCYSPFSASPTEQAVATGTPDTPVPSLFAFPPSSPSNANNDASALFETPRSPFKGLNNGASTGIVTAAKNDGNNDASSLFVNNDASSLFDTSLSPKASAPAIAPSAPVVTPVSTAAPPAVATVPTISVPTAPASRVPTKAVIRPNISSGSLFADNGSNPFAAAPGTGAAVAAPVTRKSPSPAAGASSTMFPKPPGISTAPKVTAKPAHFPPAKVTAKPVSPSSYFGRGAPPSSAHDLFSSSAIPFPSFQQPPPSSQGGPKVVPSAAGAPPPSVSGITAAPLSGGVPVKIPAKQKSSASDFFSSNSGGNDAPATLFPGGPPAAPGVKAVPVKAATPPASTSGIKTIGKGVASGNVPNKAVVGAKPASNAAVIPAVIPEGMVPTPHGLVSITGQNKPKIAAAPAPASSSKPKLQEPKFNPTVTPTKFASSPIPQSGPLLSPPPAVGHVPLVDDAAAVFSAAVEDKDEAILQAERDAIRKRAREGPPRGVVARFGFGGKLLIVYPPKPVPSYDQTAARDFNKVRVHRLGNLLKFPTQSSKVLNQLSQDAVPPQVTVDDKADTAKIMDLLTKFPGISFRMCNNDITTNIVPLSV